MCYLNQTFSCFSKWARFRSYIRVISIYRWIRQYWPVLKIQQSPERAGDLSSGFHAQYVNTLIVYLVGTDISFNRIGIYGRHNQQNASTIPLDQNKTSQRRKCSRIWFSGTISTMYINRCVCGYSCYRVVIIAILSYYPWFMSVEWVVGATCLGGIPPWKIMTAVLYFLFMPNSCIYR